MCVLLFPVGWLVACSAGGDGSVYVPFGYY